MTKLSVVISARNEEAKIDRCLSSVRWADEIIVVDNDSTDQTVRVVRKYTKKIFHRKNDPMLNRNKNFGFEQAEGEWILSLDADEEIPESLSTEIISIIGTDRPLNGYWIPRKNIIFGKWIQHGLWWPDRQLRLFRRGKGRFPCKHIHEYLEVEGPAGQIQEAYIHYNYETVSQFIRKMDDLYTGNEVENLLASHYALSWSDAIRFPVSDFVKIYFAQQGYKDGLHGLVLALLQSWYSFIVFCKLWENQEFRQYDIDLPAVGHELKRSAREIRYWDTTAAIETTSGVKAFLLRLKRKYGI